ncbi:MAG: hypothetical protein WC136_01710 [Sphaerochaeta sp.]
MTLARLISMSLTIFSEGIGRPEEKAKGAAGPKTPECHKQKREVI